MLAALITRPEPEASQWVAALQAQGVAAEAFPLICIGPAPDLAQLQRVREHWHQYRAVMFVSGNAARHFFDKNWALALTGQAREATKLVAFPRIWAPGPGTARTLQALGVPAVSIDQPAAQAAQFDSESLWQTIGARDWQGRKVLIVRGQSAGAEGASSGRDWISRQWQGAGARVDFVGVYQRRAPALTDAQIARAREASADGSVWLFSSSEAVGHLLQLAGLQGVDWHRARAIATHPRIAQAVRAAGWGVVVASRPALQDIRQSLGSIELQHP